MTGARPELTDLPLRLRKYITEQPSPPTRYTALLAAGRDPLSPCWCWSADRLNSAGYSQVKWRDRTWNVHRLTYHLLVEPLVQPGKARERDGRVVDHICERRACCNPEHLELITQSENTKRGARHRT